MEILKTIWDLVEIVCVGFTAWVIFGWIWINLRPKTKQKEELEIEEPGIEEIEMKRLGREESLKKVPKYKVGDQIIHYYSPEDPFEYITSDDLMRVIRIARNTDGHYYYLVMDCEFSIKSNSFETIGNPYSCIAADVDEGYCLVDI